MVPMALADYERAPFQFRVEATLDATADAVFDELGDPSLWYPLMQRSVWRTGATSGVGAEREVAVSMFGEFRERMLAWDRGRRLAFTMIATTSPLVARMAEDWRLVREPGGTRVSYTVAAELRPFARAMAPSLRIVMRQLFGAGVRALVKRTRWSAGHVRGTQGA
jgi:hypothetical protein